MKTLSSLALCGMLWGIAGQAALAETKLTIDDFTQGHYHSGAYNAGGNRTVSQTGSTSHLIGGNRTETIYVCPFSNPTEPCSLANPYGQYASFAIGADKSVTPGINALVLGSGYDDGVRLELLYGNGNPMSINLTPYSVFRVNFRGLTGPLNFNLLAYTGNVLRQNACNLTPNENPFVVEFSIADFGPPAASGFSWSNINSLLFIFQSSGDSLGITSIEVSDTPNPAAIACNFTPQ